MTLSRLSKTNLEVLASGLLCTLNFKCSFPFKQVVITNEKKILPCCTFWGEELVLQELKSPEDISKAWNSKKMQFLRKMVQLRNCNFT